MVHVYQDAFSLLQKLGLKDKEARVYLLCLAYKDGLFVHEIVKETKFKRSTVDLVIERLLNRGFLKQVKIGPRHKYFAQEAETLLHRQEQLTEDLRVITPLLSKIGGLRRDNEITFFEGVDGFRRVHEDALLTLKFSEGERKNMYAFSSAPDLIKIFPDMQKSFIDKRVKNGSWYKSIATQSSSQVKEWVSDQKYLRETRYVPDKDFMFKTEIQIYGDKVMIYSPAKPIGGVIIRNERIADSMRALHNLVWNLLTKPLI